MGAIPRDATSLAESLRDQLEMLATSTAAYDAGQTVAALNQATIVRVLLHDTRMSHSLLSLTGHKNGMRFWDSGIRDSVGFAVDGFTVWIEAMHEDGTTSTFPSRAQDGLITNRDIDGRPTHYPLGGEFDLASCMDFDPWWTTSFISVDHTGDLRLSRRNIVLYLANKAGGSHVDPDADADLERFRRVGHGAFTGTGHPAQQDGIFSPFSADALRATMRQIAHEVNSSIMSDGRLQDWLREHAPQ